MYKYIYFTWRNKYVCQQHIQYCLCNKRQLNISTKKEIPVLHNI